MSGGCSQDHQLFVTPAKAGAQRLGRELWHPRDLLFRLQSVSSSYGGRVTFLLRGLYRPET